MGSGKGGGGGGGGGGGDGGVFRLIPEHLKKVFRAVAQTPKKTNNNNRCYGLMP